MDKKEFIKEFERNLKGLSKEDRNEMIEDYEEHFEVGRKKGRKESEIAKSLGNPKQLAKSARIELLVNKAEKEKSAGNLFRMIFATIGMSFFNLIFVVGIFFGLLAVVISLFAVGFALTISGLALIIGGIISPVFSSFFSLGGFDPIIVILGGIGLAAFGLLFTIGTVYIGKGFYILTIKYVKLNIRIIKGRDR